jgi:cytochrome b subunit of formate dehydrogenase
VQTTRKPWWPIRGNCSPRRSNVTALLASIFLGFSVALAGTTAIRPEACADCHDAFDSKAFAASVHGGLSCTDCHSKGPFGEHEEVPAAVDCGSCHEDQAAAYAKSFHGQARAKGEKEAPSCTDCHGNAHLIFTSDDPKSVHSRGQIPSMCARCHADTKLIQKFEIPVEDPVGRYKNSVHGRAVAAGNLKAAVCSDCHGSHEIQPGREMTSNTSKRSIPQTCGKCHKDVLADYSVSVHGEAVAKGILEAPSCVDCHGEHGIVETKSPDSPVSPMHLATKTCGHCHADVTLAKRYGFSTERLSTYLQSYHGMAVRRGATTVANCSSCHGIHKILRSTDPRSSIFPGNLASTCGKCHPGASQEFARTNVHLETSPTSAPVLYYVRLLYLWVIGLTVAGMLAHNFVIYLAAVLRKLREQRASRRFRRMTKLQLIEHGLLLTSFTVLVITGFGLHYFETSWGTLLNWIGLNEELRRILHRTAGTILIFTGVFHLVHFGVTRSGRREWNALRPRWLDVKEFWIFLLHNLKTIFRPGSASVHPKWGRYSYVHKFEYWALIWGTIIMSVTGISLWFPVLVGGWMPTWGLPLMELIHYYEAWLATLAIFIWHFFFVIFHPSEYPMSLTWLTGDVTKEEMEREHPRELEEAERATTEAPPSEHEE